MQYQKFKINQLGLKRIITVAFLFMMIGTAMELYLLEHYEDTLQLIPLLCIGSAMLVMFMLFFKRTGFTEGLFKLLLMITALSGIYGTFLHLRANYEFELEMKPGSEGWDLFLESLSGALPTLAPGSMIVLALLGYSYLILLKQKQ
ncbi:MAG: hypothetical protein AB3N14_02955 [Flavobacteriaceae bacterium]